jgi:toxin-antitoxin system PIN domain toxin
MHLLDVGVLVALFWPTHESHAKAQHWFGRNAKSGWATCPFTQAAVVRILSNPASSPDALTIEEAIKILLANLEHPAHQFWTDDLSFIEAAKAFRTRLVGHQQVTGAYLLGLAMHRKGKLVTMDRAILAMLPQKNGAGSSIVVI